MEEEKKTPTIRWLGRYRERLLIDKKKHNTHNDWAT
jgi:hypothetical protein